MKPDSFEIKGMKAVIVIVLCLVIAMLADNL
jgi:hypothetical protein